MHADDGKKFACAPFAAGKDRIYFPGFAKFGNAEAMRTLLCLPDQDRAAFVAPGAEAEAIGRLSDDLDDLDAPGLPGDFLEFLARSDGLLWREVEICGTGRIVRERTGHVVPALAEINAAYAEIPGMAGRLVVGRSATELYVYDQGRGRYLVLDRRVLAEKRGFSSFAKLLESVVRERPREPRNGP